MIRVFHLETEDREKRFRAMGLGEADPAWIRDGEYREVARVETSHLEWAFQATNNITGSWSLEPVPEVTVIWPEGREDDGMGLRSSSMGDVFQHDGVLFSVAQFGFEPVGGADDLLPEHMRLAADPG